MSWIIGNSCREESRGRIVHVVAAEFLSLRMFYIVGVLTRTTKKVRHIFPLQILCKCSIWKECSHDSRKLFCTVQCLQGEPWLILVIMPNMLKILSTHKLKALQLSLHIIGRMTMHSDSICNE